MRTFSAPKNFLFIPLLFWASLYPVFVWDILLIMFFLLFFQSVKKTGRVIIAHEAPLTGGFGAELAATIQV